MRLILSLITTLGLYVLSLMLIKIGIYSLSYLLGMISIIIVERIHNSY